MVEKNRGQTVKLNAFRSHNITQEPKRDKGKIKQRERQTRFSGADERDKKHAFMKASSISYVITRQSREKFL